MKGEVHRLVRCIIGDGYSFGGSSIYGVIGQLDRIGWQRSGFVMAYGPANADTGARGAVSPGFPARTNQPTVGIEELALGISVDSDVWVKSDDISTPAQFTISMPGSSVT